MINETVVLAHGVGGRSDLPVPFSFAVTGAAVALVISFLALAFLWPTARLERPHAGRPLPSRLAAFLDSPAFRWALRGIGLVATGYVLFAAIAGPDTALNPTAGVVYVIFWIVTLVIASVLFGPIWRALNPVRTLHLLLARATGQDPRVGLLRYPARLGSWPAAIALFSFVWLELVAPNRASTEVLLTYIALYAGIMFVGAILFGSEFFDRADGLERYSTLFGRLAVVGRRDDGALVLRNPLVGLATLRTEPGLAAFVVVMLGSTAYDGFSNAPVWVRWTQSSSLPSWATGGLGLSLMVAIVAVTYVIATALAGRLGGRPASAMPGAFAHSLVPIALGYVLSHYYSLVVVIGQQTVQRLSDPLVDGSNWLGTANLETSYALITPTAVALIQVIGVVAGHVIGVVSAHDRGVALFPRSKAVAGQIPLLVVMVGYTLGGLLLLFSG